MGVSSTPSKDIFMTFLAHPSGTGFSVDATFQNLFPTVGGISSIHFKPSHEITFYSDDEKPNTCYYTGVIDREGKVEVILVDPYEMEDNRCKELTASYGDNFLNNGVTLDMKSMDAMILGKNGKTDIYTITEGRSDEGYCMGPDNSGRLDCTFKRVEGPANEVSFHLNGKVDIFNDRQERVRCDYIVKDKTDVKLTCPEPTKGMRCLVESLTENVELRRKVGSLELTAEVSNELCWTADTHVYKQVEWEKAFFDFNLERVRDGLTLDATFSADDSSQTIATVAMKDNGDIEFAGGKKKCKYREGKVKVILVDPYEMEDNRCKELTASYGDNFLNNGVTLDMKSKTAIITDDEGHQDSYDMSHTGSGPEPGYCVGINDNGRLECTLRCTMGIVIEISLHLNGKVDIFNDRQERVRCDYIVKDKTDVKLTCPTIRNTFGILAKTQFVDTRGPLEMLTAITDSRDHEQWFIYKQIKWEKAFFDYNLERVHQKVALDAIFSSSNKNSERRIATVKMDTDRGIEIVGDRRKCKCQYKAIFDSESGAINIDLKSAISPDCQTILRGSTSGSTISLAKPQVSEARSGLGTLGKQMKGAFQSTLSLARDFKVTRKSVMVITNRALKRLMTYFDDGNAEVLESTGKNSKAFIKE
ncbi:hypothetical protein FOL47_009321 [Perkinsus chesapeaki]|uniref:Uncharacterized protein n=1 Tax=Perkinsus chesapeaki TaxID=330153 RepID=A0A7J6L947_PERCH|nr:hypothetical protein FOL47_009321 [Perkinsus chesapeaki]